MISTRCRLIVLAIAISTLSGAAMAVAQERADRILVSGVIHTVDEAAPRAEAMAIADGRIVGVGSTDEIRARFSGPETEVIDLQGRTVLPGLIDAHAHVIGLGEALRVVDLIGTSSAEEIASLVVDAAGEATDGAWIIGRGWDQNDWAVKAFPTRVVLDAAIPGDEDPPVALERVDGHAFWVNTAALARSGITRDTPDPEGGRILKDDAGEPTGILIDDAMDLVEDAIGRPDEAELDARLAAAHERLVSLGVTGVHTMGDKSYEVETYARWARDGRLKSRIVVYMDSNEAGILDWWEAEGRDAMPDSPHFEVPGVKLYADGALGSRGAALFDDYSDDPGNVGLLVTPPDTLAGLAARAVSMGLQPVIHAIGDRGNSVALDAIAAAEIPDDALPARIEHSQVIRLEEIERFADLGVVASVQPTHATSDMYWAEDRVGPERIRGAYAWRKLRDADVTVVCGSDFPVERPNPFHGLYAAIARQDQEGWPEGGWYPDERMTREEALACFTRDAAAVVDMADEVGSLAPGKRADYIVLDRDFMTVPVEEIWRIEVVRTVIDGEIVYDRDAPQ